MLAIAEDVGDKIGRIMASTAMAAGDTVWRGIDEANAAGIPAGLHRPTVERAARLAFEDFVAHHASTK